MRRLFGIIQDYLGIPVFLFAIHNHTSQSPKKSVVSLYDKNPPKYSAHLQIMETVSAITFSLFAFSTAPLAISITPVRIPDGSISLWTFCK